MSDSALEDKDEVFRLTDTGRLLCCSFPLSLFVHLCALKKKTFVSSVFSWLPRESLAK